MDLRQLTDDLAVAPQIEPEDIRRLADAGYTTVIANRPDSELEPSHHSRRMAELAAQAGIAFHYVPIMPGQLGPEQVQALRDIVENAEGKVLAYCRSGTRSTMAWALGQAGRRPTRDIMQAAASAGYDLSDLIPR
ncbi:TIGR01244 family sulfur transferase [Paracoccus alkenifer]|uniref:TIGR01244 family protein n=1 Tax=Paracoccus alkenifer TaxID=65735 RepID=A0A1H6LR61_9RHOB|nr:TIGR01244 family sulfur transferase [Paracoccus alkenifer]SEH91171.1 TIGR01244 family protein [Paracoccus alkenifer]